MLDVSVVIVTYNTRNITLDCLASIFRKQTDLKFDVWVLDNGSVDGTFDEIKSKYPKVHLVRSDKNLGFVGGNNTLIRKVYKNSKFTLVLNSDTEVSEDTLDKLFSFAQEKTADIVSCELRNKNGTFQPNAGDLPRPLPLLLWLSQLDGVFGRFLKVPSFHQYKKDYYWDGREVGWVSGSLMFIKSSVFGDIGFFDPKIFAYGEDSEFCWRAQKKGYKIYWTNSTKIMHIGGASLTEPNYTQWLGEFKGLLYLYTKYYGKFASMVLKLFIYFFTFLRIVAFFVAGKPAYSKNYAKIITNL